MADLDGLAMQTLGDHGWHEEQLQEVYRRSLSSHCSIVSYELPYHRMSIA